MIHKLLILTSDDTLLRWNTLEEKKQLILDALAKTRNGVWELEIKYQPLVPQLNDKKRISHSWFDSISHPYFRRGYHFVAMHFSMAQWELWGIESGINGATHRDKDFVGDMYFRADELTMHKNFKGLRYKHRYTQFVQTLLHEVSHELANSTGVADQTHDYHKKNKDISGIFEAYDMARWQPVYREQVSTVMRLIEKLKSLITPSATTLYHPVQFKPRLVSQAWGVRNPGWYPKTGHHIGVDYPLPVGTPLYAPWDCEVLVSGTTDTVGHFCRLRYQFQGEWWEERWIHLKSIPATGHFKRGQVIAYSGNTGKSTGPHLHRERWRDRFDFERIDGENWYELTVNPESEIV